ncbi:MAG: DUF167 family protein [Pseudomonadota bacterium]
MTRPATSLKIRESEHGIAIAVRLTPRSAMDAVDGVEAFGGDYVLKARVRAVPDKGEANRALEGLIADWLGIARSTVQVIQGQKSRTKIVSIDGSAIGVSALIATRLTEFQYARPSAPPRPCASPKPSRS